MWTTATPPPPAIPLATTFFSSMTFRGGSAGRGVCVCVRVCATADWFIFRLFLPFLLLLWLFPWLVSYLLLFPLTLSRCIFLFLSPAQFSRSRRKLFNAEMGNVMKKFLFFLSLCRGVLRVERKRKEEKKAQETPFISDVLFSLLCSPCLSLPHSRFFCRLCCH